MEWASKLDELRKLAKTMTRVEMAKHYGVKPSALNNTLRRYGIYPQEVRHIWLEREQELRELAKSMTAEQIAKQFGIKTKRIREILCRMKIKAIRMKHARRWVLIANQLREEAKTMSARQMAEKHGVITCVMHETLRRFKIQALPAKYTRRPVWMPADAVLHEMCKTMTVKEIARALGDLRTETVRETLRRNGFKPQICTPVKREKPKKPKKPTLIDTHGDAIREMSKTMTQAQISRELGIKDSTMSKLCKRLGVVCYQPLIKPKAAHKPGTRRSDPIKQWSPPVKVERQIIFPDSVKVQVIEPKPHWRSKLTAPIYNPAKQPITTRF